MNYRNRSLCFALLFATLGSHMMDQGYGMLPWVLLVTQFLVYPHVIYWWARRSTAAGQAELNNMVLDTAAFGAWAGALGFPLWITFILFVAATVNIGVFRGIRGIALATAAMGVGALLGFGITGAQVSSTTSGLTTALSIACVLFYLLMVALGAYNRTLKLHEARQHLRHNEQALQSAYDALQQRLNEIHVLQSQLTEQASRDPLTGLFNRRYLDATIEREVARCKREGQPLSVILIDIDHFKSINDTYGHQAGDQVLRTLAQLFQARATDVACRYGGEEFLLLLPNMPLEVARERAEQLRALFAGATIVFGEFRIRVTLSAGVAAYPGQGISPEELIRSADTALYRAKAEGRDRVLVFDDPVLLPTSDNVTALLRAA
jgi:diguanylate cyclase (GGDEF)-like protein